MRGNPRLEWVMVLLLGLLLAWPLARLTRGAPAQMGFAPGEPLAATDTETWFDLRFSHPPRSFVLSQGETVLASGGGSHREEAESILRVTDGQARVSLRIEWAGDLPGAYTELAVEPEGLHRRVEGFWSQGETVRNLEFLWPTP